jgi:adenylate kinase
LIKSAREKLTASPLTADELRKGNINDNQSLLIEGFRLARKPEPSLVVLDGHTVIDTPSGLVKIAPGVFEALGIDCFIFLAEEAEIIFQRRRDDQSRDRPLRSTAELFEQQEQALLAAFQAACTVRVPLHVFRAEHTKKILDLLIAFYGCDRQNNS